LVKNQPLTRLGDTKTYRGVYTVRPGDRLTDGILSVTYRDPQGRQGTMEATARISIDTGLPTALALTLPVDQSQVGDMIVAAGQAPPYSRVRVTIAYDTRIITQITGQLWQGTVVTDAKGVWRTAEISSSLGYLGRANNYTVLAELLDNAGKVVAQKQVKLHK
jgi:hypothetical protein